MLAVQSRSIIWARYSYSCLLSIPQCDELSLEPQRPSTTKQVSWHDAFDCRRVSLARTQLDILTTYVRIPKRIHKLHIPSESFISGLLAPRGDAKKQENTHTHTSYVHTATGLAIAMFTFDTRDSVVAGVGIADGSRAKYDVGI